MARKKVNKAKAIREYHKAHPEEGPTAIVQALKKQKVSVTAQQVSTTLSNARRKERSNGKASSTLGRPRKARGRRTAEMQSNMSAEQLKQAAALVRACGGMDEALQAVRDAKEIASSFSAS